MCYRLDAYDVSRVVIYNREGEEMVRNVASTHIGIFATKTEGRTVEKEFYKG
jgi:hypothetical protein